MSEVAELVLGTLVLRSYVFAFLVVYLVAAVAAWGHRRAVAFTVLAWGVAFLAEWSSTRVGIPFGLYHYTGATRGRELYLSNVPFFDALSFSFLAWASLGVARVVVAGRLVPRGRGSGSAAAVAVAAALLMVWLDVVIDPLAVRGDRWFLGRIFYYPEPGPYFGVPLANFAGWAAVGVVIAATWLCVEPWIGGTPPAWGARLPGRPYHAVGLYYLVLGFNLAVTWVVAEPLLFWVGVALHVPVAALVVSSLPSGARTDGAEAPAPERQRP